MSKLRKVIYYIGIGIGILGLVFDVLYKLTRHNSLTDKHNNSFIFFILGTIMIIVGYVLIKICERGENESESVLDNDKTSEN